MYDPKFEKGVRQKMEGLQFSPPESVWVNIEKAIATRHRRRTAFFFWRFAIPGMLFAGAVGALYLMARPVANSSTAHPSLVTSPAPASPVAALSPLTPKTATPPATEASPDRAATARMGASRTTIANPAAARPATAWKRHTEIIK